MKSFRFFFLFLLISLSALVSCRPESPAALTTPLSVALSEEELMETAIAQVTEAAFLTQAVLPTATATSTATPLPEITQIPTIVRSPTPAPSPTSDQICNKAAAGVPFDLSVPDGSQMYAGQEFVKTWRIVNQGACKWTRLYKLVYFSQNSMGAQQEQFLPGEVLPGQAIDLSVTFYAPITPGTYQSNWMLMDPDGKLFGLGFNADGPFYVRIVVTNEPTPIPTPKDD